jgi:hypothetical protein
LRSGEQKAQNNITLLVITLTVIHSISNIPYAIRFIIDELYIESIKTSFIYFSYQLLAVTLLYTSHTINFFIYYFHNNLFKKIFWKIIKLDFTDY